MIIYPSSEIKRRIKNNVPELWDIIRRQWLKLTPEELVRQSFVHYLIKVKKYPKEKILIEKEIQIYNTQKRFDVAIVKSPTDYFLIAECKAPYVELNEATIQQALTYNINLKASILVITNGVKEFVFQNTGTEWAPIKNIPQYL